MKNFIEIDKKPVIFDDPEYCESSGQICLFCDKYEWKCNFFTNAKSLEKDSILRWCRKTDECKKEWQAAKERQSEPCHKCKNLRGLNEYGGLVCPCPHCGDEVPF